MVFFTIIIVVKYFLGMEKCPLFEDSVANGTMPFEDYVQDKTNFNSLRDHYLEPAGASKLLGEHPTGTYIVGNSSTGVHGHITPACPNQYQLPEEYCNLQEQVCDAGMFNFNEKVAVKLVHF